MAEIRAVNAVSDSFDLQQVARTSVQEAMKDYVQQRTSVIFPTSSGRGRGCMGNQLSRTPDGRLICFKCKEPGHTCIHCPKHGFSAGVVDKDTFYMNAPLELRCREIKQDMLL